MKKLSFVLFFVFSVSLFAYDADYYYEKAKKMYNRKDLKNTVKYLNKSLEKDSSFYKTYVFYGKINYFLKKYYKTISFLNKALEYEKKDYYLYYLLAITHDKFKNIDLTLENYQKAISLNPKHYPTLYNLAIKYYDLDSLDFSKKYCYRALAINKSAIIYSKIALIYYKQNIWDSTVFYLKKSLKINNKDPLAYKILGDIYFQKNDYMNAKYYFKQAISLEDFYTDAYYQLGNVCLALKDGNGALENYFKVIPFINNEEISYKIALAYFYLKNYEKSIDYLKKANMKYPEVKLLAGKIAYEIKNYEKSIEFYKNLAKTDTLKKDTYFYELSYLYEKDSSLTLSLQNINKALEIKPDNLVYLYRLAEVYFLQNKYNEAIKVLEDLKLKDEFNPKVYILLGICYNEVLRINEAKDAYKIAYKLDKSNSEPYYFYGIYYYNKGEYDFALKLFSNVLMMDANNPDALYYYGRILYEKSKANISYLEKAKALGSTEAAEFLLKITNEKKE